MRKVFKSFLLIAFMALLINVSKVKAAGELVIPVDGASIRLKTEEKEQGLRFYAKLDESVKDKEHGFYLVYGATTVNALEEAINAADGGTITLNGKVVFEVAVPAVREENEYSVVLLGIPEEGYLDQLSVIPYVMVNGNLVLPEEPVIRSVGEVALKLANAGETVPEDILEALSEKYKRVAFNAFDELEITDNLFETNHFLLRKEFIKDWNAMFGTIWTSLDATTFYNSAKTGLSGGAGSNKDLSPSNLYKFFKDEDYGTKWMWVLDYIDLKGDVHPRKQIVAIKGDGTNADNLLYNAEHLGYSIPNFFNGRNDSAGYAAINFTSPSKYDSVQNYNDKIYVDVANYEYLAVGESYTIPAAEARLGYNFVNYKDGSLEVNPGAYEITAANKLFAKVYQAIVYDVTFYDDELELTDLNTTYTIEDELTLPVPSIEGKVFEGWYDNPESTGTAVTKITEGSTGAKTFYGKFVETNNVPVEVTFKLNGGKLNAEQMIEHRTSNNIVATRYSNVGDGGQSITVGPGRGGQYWYVMGFKETGVEGVYEFVSKGTNYSDPEATLFISYHDAVSGDYAAAIKAKYNSITAGELVVIPWLPVSYTGTTTVNMYFMNSTALTADVVLTLIEEEILFVPVGDNDFLGWYDNSEFEGDPITTYPGYKPIDEVYSIIYYANWEEKEEDIAVIYDLGEYGYLSEETKSTLLFDFVTDYKALYGRACSAQELYDDFAGKSYIVAPYDIKDIFQPEYKNGKWTWIYEYLIYMAEETGYGELANLSSYTLLTLRTNIHGFILEEQYTLASSTSMDFTTEDAINGFWRFTSYNKIVKDEEDPILDGSTISSWKTGYVFGGWYDNPEFTGSAITEIPVDLEGNYILYANWEKA